MPKWEQICWVARLPGGKWFLGLLGSWWASRVAKTGTRVFFDQVWVHGTPEGYVAHRKIKPGTSIAELCAVTRDYYLYLYDPKPGDIVVDIGAGIGAETLTLARAVGPTGLVVSIEAHPETFTCLRKLCEYNGLDNVVPIKCAVAEREGAHLCIEDHKRHISNRVVEDDTGIQVRVTTVDAVIREIKLSRIDFLKMNIEGAEKRAIIGMTNAIRITRNIVIACHDFRADRDGLPEMCTKQCIVDFLQANDFEITTRMNDSRPWVRNHVYGTNRRYVGYCP